jgi:hypothetical protein
VQPENNTLTGDDRTPPWVDAMRRTVDSEWTSGAPPVDTFFLDGR